MNESHAGLRSSERFDVIKTLASNLEIAVCFASEDGNVIYTNELFKKYTGYNPFEKDHGCILKHALNIRKDEVFNKLNSDESPDSLEIEDVFQFSDQGLIKLKFKLSKLSHLNAVMIQLIDYELLNEIKSSINSLLKRYTSPLKIENEFVLIINKDGKIQGIDQVGLSMLEEDEDQIIGKPFFSLFDERQIDLEFFKFEQFTLGQTHTREVWLKCKSQSLPFELMLRRELYSDSEFLVIVARDISIRHSYEDRLNRTLEIFKIITTYSTDVICIFNENQDLVFMSPTISELTGHNVEELMILGFHSTILKDDRKKYSQSFAIA